MEKITVNYTTLKSFVDNDRSTYDDIVKRFASGDAALTLDQIAQAYYATPFAGFVPLTALVATANQLYRNRDYRMAYFMYLDALEQDPFSLLLLKKAANASYLGAIDEAATRQLRDKVKRLQEVIKATGDGATPDTAFKVTQVNDEYEILYDIFHVKDVISQSVVRRDGAQVCDEMTVMILGDTAPRKVYFDVYGETEADMQDFFNRKKTY